MPDASASVAAAAARAGAPARRLRRHRAGPPEVLARRLGRTIPLVYGSAGIAAVAAHWWKAQVNLNAKAPSFAGDAAGADPRRAGGLGAGR